MGWTNLVEYLLYVAVIVVVSCLSEPLVKYLKAKGNEAVAKVDNEKVQKYLSLAVDAVTKSVLYVSQTYVESLKKSGEFNSETGKVAFEKAKERALELLSEESKVVITTVYKDLDAWLETTIEAEVILQKKCNITAEGETISING